MTAHQPDSVSGFRPILITGGCGFIGCHLADALARRGAKVLLLDNLARDGSLEHARWLKSRHEARIDIKRCDIRDRDAVTSAVATAGAVLHLAGQVAVTTSVDSPIDDFETNARGTLNVLEAVRTRNPEAPVLFASTNKVYGLVLDRDQVRREGTHYSPAAPEYSDGIDEEAPLDFHSPYGCSKGSADQYVRDYARVFGLRTVVMRMSCIYGPRQFGTEDQGWIAHFFLKAMRGEPVTVYGDGYQVRDALHVDDAVAAWLAALARIDSVKGRVFNLGGGRGNAISLRELLAMMADLNRHPTDVRYSDWRPGDQPWYVSDTRRLERELGWQPRMPLARGLQTLNEWLTARFDVKSQTAAMAGAAS